MDGDWFVLSVCQCSRRQNWFRLPVRVRWKPSTAMVAPVCGGSASWGNCEPAERQPLARAPVGIGHGEQGQAVRRGAQDFARQLGFPIEADLNTEHSRRLWLEWKRRVDPEHWLDPARRDAAAERARQSMIADGLLNPEHVYGTIHCHAIGPKGEVAGATTTSGLAWKIPGRVGDSPILGAGNWVDAEAGAAGSTGRGEANLYNLCSHLIVELMRQGRSPKDSGLEALRRVCTNTVEKRLLVRPGVPRFDLKFYVSNLRGECAGVALYRNAEARFAVCDASGPRLEPLEGLLPAAEGVTR